MVAKLEGRLGEEMGGERKKKREPSKKRAPAGEVGRVCWTFWGRRGSGTDQGWLGLGGGGFAECRERFLNREPRRQRRGEGAGYFCLDGRKRFGNKMEILQWATRQRDGGPGLRQMRAHLTCKRWRAAASFGAIGSSVLGCFRYVASAGETLADRRVGWDAGQTLEKTPASAPSLAPSSPQSMVSL